MDTFQNYSQFQLNSQLSEVSQHLSKQQQSEFSNVSDGMRKNTAKQSQ